MDRTILHCDMNSFFASVEIARRPELARVPMAVCGSIEERHGIILAKNQLAKPYGIETGEPVVQAMRKCPRLVTVEADYDEYIKFSRAARKIYDGYTDLVEPLGIDECWLDVTGSRRLFGDGLTIAETLRERIKRELGVTVSVGVSFNKVFAKLGSDMKKPDAVTCIPRESFRQMIWGLPVSDLFGVGRATAEKLRACGIVTIGQLANAYPPMIKYRLGVNGLRLIAAAAGRDETPVLPGDAVIEAKSVSRGTTTRRDMETPDDVRAVMFALCEDIGHKLLLCRQKACGVAVYARDNSLSHFQYRARLPEPTDSYSVIAKAAFELFMRKHSFSLPLRSVTVGATELCRDTVPQQTSFFTDSQSVYRSEILDRTMDGINRRFGKNSIRYALLYGSDLSGVEATVGFAKTGESASSGAWG